MSIHINAGSTTVNVSTPVNVVASAYDTSGNGGRKQVLLSNGWVVGTTYDSATGYIRFHVNKLDGNGFSQLAYAGAWTGGNVYWAITSVGTVVHLVATTASATNLCYLKFDAVTQTNVDVWGTKTFIDTSQTAFSGASITAHTDGTLHAAWASKNATYPNSFNLRYSKSTDGGVTWAAVTQITTLNTSGNNYQNPCIVMLANGYPGFVYDYVTNGTYYITFRRWGGSAWQSAVVYSGGTYAQSNPCATVAPDGTIHVVGHGTDSIDKSKRNIRYSKSTDGGVTWIAPIKLTTGNTYDQLSPSVACRSDGRIYVMWHGQHAGSTTYTQIRQRYYGLPDIGGGGIDWQGISNLTSASTHQTNVQTCGTVNTFQDYPLHIWADAAGSVKFRGAWTVSGIKTVTQASVNVGGLWKPATVYINTGAWKQV